MPSYTIEKLVEGVDDIVTYYDRARRLWREILNSNQAANEGQLASAVTGSQTRFEAECGGRWLGQEIMAYVGIGQFYSTQSGFAANEAAALRVYRAIQGSFCSFEVKVYSRQAAEQYGLAT